MLVYARMSAESNDMFAHWVGKAAAEKHSAVEFILGEHAVPHSTGSLENTALTMQWCGNTTLWQSRDEILVPCGREIGSARV